MSSSRPSLAPLPLRLILGISFLVHGLGKISSQAGHDRFAGLLQGLNVPLPGPTAWLVGVVEVSGALALLLGAFVLWACIPLIADMFVALFKVHLGQGFNFVHISSLGPDGPIFGMPGYEVILLYLAALLSLIFSGAGAYSLDRRINPGASG